MRGGQLMRLALLKWFVVFLVVGWWIAGRASLVWETSSLVVQRMIVCNTQVSGSELILGATTSVLATLIPLIVPVPYGPTLQWRDVERQKFNVDTLILCGKEREHPSPFLCITLIYYQTAVL